MEKPRSYLIGELIIRIRNEKADNSTYHNSESLREQFVEAFIAGQKPSDRVLLLGTGKDRFAKRAFEGDLGAAIAVYYHRTFSPNWVTKLEIRQEKTVAEVRFDDGKRHLYGMESHTNPAYAVMMAYLSAIQND